MKKKKAADLRRRAEEKIKVEVGKAQKLTPTVGRRNGVPEGAGFQVSPEEMQQMIHELRVHQIELETQNEELRRIQLELAASQARFFDLYDLAPIGYCTLSEQGLIIEGNLTMAAMLGVGRSDLARQPLSRFVLKEDQDIYYLHRKRLFETGEAQVCELRIMKKEGTMIWIRLEATIVQETRAEASAMCRVVLSDISLQKSAEREMRLLAARNQALLEAITDIIMEVNTDKVYTWANRAGLEFFGADVLGKEAAFYFAGEQDVYDMVQPLFAGSENIFYVESWQRRRDGQERLLAWWCRTLKDEYGNVAGALSSARDITESKKIEEERSKMLGALSAKNEELERFTYNVSHDLKSPLVTIRTFLGHLGQDMTAMDMEKIKEDIGYIGSGAEKMSRLLDELLDLSRIGRKSNQPEDFSLQSIVKEALDIVAGRLTEHRVEVNITKGEIMLRGDRTRLVEVFQNLLDNACKFMGEQKSPLIKIGAETKAGETVIFVRDNGMGIKKQFLPKLFIMFEKYNRSCEGDGIGLALVKRIVEVHGGRIWVESEGSGKGTTFYFALPKTT